MQLVIAAQNNQNCVECFAMLLHPPATVDTMGVLTAAEGERSLLTGDSTRWDKLTSKFANIFAEPGKPVERTVKHTINLLPGLRPPA